MLPDGILRLTAVGYHIRGAGDVAFLFRHDTSSIGHFPVADSSMCLWEANATCSGRSLQVAPIISLHRPLRGGVEPVGPPLLLSAVDQLYS